MSGTGTESALPGPIASIALGTGPPTSRPATTAPELSEVGPPWNVLFSCVPMTPVSSRLRAAVRALRGDRRLERPVDVVPEARVLRDVLRHVLECRAIARHGIDVVDPSVVPVVYERLPARVLRGARAGEEDCSGGGHEHEQGCSEGASHENWRRSGISIFRTSDCSLCERPPKARRELMSVSTMAVTPG